MTEFEKKVRDEVYTACVSYAKGNDINETVDLAVSNIKLAVKGTPVSREKPEWGFDVLIGKDEDIKWVIGTEEYPFEGTRWADLSTF